MHWWTPLVERLRSDFRLIRIDLLGHGGSQKPDGGYSMEHQARQVALALSTLRIQHAVIAGHSMGGIVATALTELDPSMVDGLVLIGSPSNKDAGELALPCPTRLCSGHRGGDPPRSDRWHGSDNLEKAFAPVTSTSLTNSSTTSGEMTYTSYDSSHDESGDYNDSTPISERLAKFDKPLLVIQGDGRRLRRSPSQARELPGRQHRLLPATGHTPMVERPDETARLIGPFVTNNNRGPADRPPRKSLVKQNQ